MAEQVHWFLSYNVPLEQRFRAFQTAHFIYMIAGTTAIIAAALIIRKYNQHRTQQIIKGCAIFLFIFYFLRAYMFYRYFANFHFLDLLPLHLCIISAFVIPLTVILKNKLMWSLAYSVLMPGAIIAIVTPEMTLNRYHAFGWMPLIFFIWHFLVAAIPIMQVASGDYKPNIRDYPKVLLILCGYAIFIFVLNKQLNTNYLYLNYAARGTVLEIFDKWLGNPGYIIPLAVLVFLVCFLMFLPWYIKEKKD